MAIELGFSLGLVFLCAVVVWRSKLVRAVFLESIAHPLRRASLEAEGDQVRIVVAPAQSAKTPWAAASH